MMDADMAPGPQLTCYLDLLRRGFVVLADPEWIQRRGRARLPTSGGSQRHTESGLLYLHLSDALHNLPDLLTQWHAFDEERSRREVRTPPPWLPARSARAWRYVFHSQGSWPPARFGARLLCGRRRSESQAHEVQTDGTPMAPAGLAPPGPMAAALRVMYHGLVVIRNVTPQFETVPACRLLATALRDLADLALHYQPGGEARLRATVAALRAETPAAWQHVWQSFEGIADRGTGEPQ